MLHMNIKARKINIQFYEFCVTFRISPFSNMYDLQD